MPIPFSIVCMFALGIALIALIGRLLLVPGKILFRIVLSGIAGCLLLTGINLLSGITHLLLPLNPFSALTAGFLGIPGVLLLIALKVFL